MTELHAHRTDAFCLVIGDGDFTRLAIAIRERGFAVLGFGATSTPASLRAACTEFHVFDDPTQARVKAATVSGGKWNAKVPVIVRDRREFSDFVRNLTGAKGRATFSRINHEACRRDPNFSPRRYGASSLRRLINHLDGFTVHPITNEHGVITDCEAVLKEERTAATP